MRGCKQAQFTNAAETLAKLARTYNISDNLVYESFETKIQIPFDKACHLWWGWGGGRGVGEGWIKSGTSDSWVKRDKREEKFLS